MLLRDVVKVDVCDRIVRAIRQVQVKVFSSVEVNPLLLVKVVLGQWVRLKHLGFKVLLLKQKLFEDLLTNVHTVNMIFLGSLHVQLLLDLRYFEPLHDDDLSLFNRLDTCPKTTINALASSNLQVWE